MSEGTWVWSDHTSGQCELCDKTVTGPGWVEFARYGPGEAPVRFICWRCDRQDYLTWYAVKKGGLQQSKTSKAAPVLQANMSMPPPSPVPQASVSTEQPPKVPTIPVTGETVFKQVLRDAKTGMISGVMETTYSAADARKRKLEQRTPEQWEAAIHSYEKWKRARNRKSRGR